MITEEKMQEIRQVLHKLEEEKGIKIIVGVESGSRAWGIPSVDSDYDVRFVYVYTDKRKYIDFEAVHEDEIVLRENDLDIKGYDIRRAYGFIYHGEANVYEWLASDIVYVEDKGLKWLIQDAADANFDVGSVARCYYGMAKRTYVHDMHWVDQVKAKKYLYCLRSILCCRYVLENNRPVPLCIDKLTNHMTPDDRVELDRLLKIKTETVDNTKTARSHALEDDVLMELTKLEAMLRGRWANTDKSTEQMNSLLLKYIQID